MTDWHSRLTLVANALSFSKFVHALLGIYAWEWAISLDFDIPFLTGKRKFQWPMIFYFYGRYGLLGGLIGLVIILDSTTEINCMAAFRTLSVIGNTCLGVSSINLFIRTMAIWGRNRYIMSMLILLSTGHFGIIFRSITTVKSKWVDGFGCVTTDAQPTIFAVMYIYTMVFDLIILILTGYKLWYLNLGIQSSAVMKLLFQDGLVHFIVAFTVNAVAVIFSLMDLNPIMAVIADIPATTFATISAGRVVRRLSKHSTTSGDSQELCLDTGFSVRFNSHSRGTSHGAGSTTRSGVHIEMATLPQRDDERSMGGYKKGQDQQPDLEANEPVFEHRGS